MASPEQALFEVLATPREWIIHRLFDLMIQQDFIELLSLICQYGFNPAYSVNYGFQPKNAEHMSKYTSGTKYMNRLQRQSNNDPLVNISDVKRLCEEKNIPMVVLLIIY